MCITFYLKMETDAIITFHIEAGFDMFWNELLNRICTVRTVSVGERFQQARQDTEICSLVRDKYNRH